MKKFFLIYAVIQLALPAGATSYNCRLSDSSAKDPQSVTFSINTDVEDQKFVDLGDNVALGCVVFRAKPQVITCGLGSEENFSLFATADDGTSILSVNSSSQGLTSNLTCLRQ